MQRLPPELASTESRRFMDLVVALCQEHVSCLVKAHGAPQGGDWATIGSGMGQRQFTSMQRSSTNFDARSSRPGTGSAQLRTSMLNFAGFSAIAPPTQKDDSADFALVDAPVPEERENKPVEKIVEEKSGESFDPTGDRYAAVSASCSLGEDEDYGFALSKASKHSTRISFQDGGRSEHTSHTRSTRTEMTGLRSSLMARDFELLLPWQEQDFSNHGRRSSHCSNASVPSEKTEAIYESETLQPLINCAAAHPSSPKRLAWDILCLFWLLYDMVVVPLQAFDLSDSGLVSTCDWCARMVWTIDMPLSACVGFYLKGKLQLEFRAAVHHYFTTWFWPDLVLVVVDWVSFFWSLAEDEDSDSGSQSMGVVKMLRIARLMRALRLLRLLKMQRLLQGVEDLINTEAVSIYFKCLKPIVGIILLVHILACGWYFIGWQGQENDGINWLTHSTILPRTKGYQYSTCLHWSLSQFTVSNMDVHAVNLGERIYTIIVLVFGIVAFSSLVGGFTSAVEQLRELKRDETNQFWLLRCLLKDYSISVRLTTRIVRYCEYSYFQQKKRKQFGDVVLLNLLSDQLQEELLLEIHAPQLWSHPLFWKMHKSHCLCLQKVCAKTTRSPSFAKGDSLFTKGEIATGLMLVTDGMCQYGWKLPDGTRYVLGVSPGQDFMCEASLWTEWTTLGHAKAQENTNTLEVVSGLFGPIVCDALPTDWSMIQQYAFRYVHILNQKEKYDLTDIMDALSPEEDRSDEGIVNKGESAQGIIGASIGVILEATEMVQNRVRRMSFHSIRGVGAGGGGSSPMSPRIPDTPRRGGDSPKRQESAQSSPPKLMFGRNAPKVA